MSAIPIKIVRRQDKALVDAILHTELTPKVLGDTEKEWGPIRLAAAKKLHAAGKFQGIPQHFHWDWDRKSGKLKLLSYQSLGIECAGKFQGLLMVDLAGRVARIDPDVGKPLVYIEYLEAAPWNLSMMVDTPMYCGIGPVLMQAAVELSCDQGFHGRLGLHALPQSEGFYRDDYEMQCCGPDASFEDLPYYEMTRVIAARFTTNSSGGAV
ncbi:hypothetical protein KIH39_00750 [Telmatocola sphagniphila]|uniref:Uncharacterized protein n=1 Tax=Telmatocola sphagniphila TaxID=1123043 RepID=A0A8E6B8I4_9BACT|nr:hypothetical protein [Telmatocola sphagniphila]QVL32478.1 hypothetical protein KIH39_00750 [Telmatocola sphagniphila]